MYNNKHDKKLDDNNVLLDCSVTTLKLGALCVIFFPPVKIDR